MHIEELKEGDSEGEEELVCGEFSTETVISSDAKRTLVGAGARALFYPTLLYNVVRNKIQTEFRWWDKVDEFILLGAVPFPADVPRLKALGVCGVVTLNEPYETLVTTSLYHEHNIDHLVIPTRDYLFAPAFGDICQAVDFIHGNALCGKTTYVHCKAGRGRSTTVVLCYLVKHKHMTPEAAYEHVRSIRPRVLLASSQWQAVQNYYYQMKKTNICEKSLVTKTLYIPGKELDPGALKDCYLSSELKALSFQEKIDPAVLKDDSLSSELNTLSFQEKVDPALFDDCSMVLVTESDLEGYDESQESGVVDKNMLAELNGACRFQFASQAAIARLSCLWFRCETTEKVSMKKLEDSMSNAQLENLGVDIHVY